MMKIQHALVTSLLLLLGTLVSSYAQQSLDAYPSVVQETCTLKVGEPKELQQQQLKKKRIIDLTHAMRPDLPMFAEDEPLGEALRLVASMDEGFEYNLSEMKMSAHTGTHLDAPGHFYNEDYKAGNDVSHLDLEVLVGPVLIVDIPRDSNITAEVLEKLNIPRGVVRVLFRTSNTDRGLMWKPKFDSSYTGFTREGAEWLLHHRPEVKLVGTDYLSVARFDNLFDAHLVLLGKKLILVEGLLLDNVEVGLSNLYCLPLRLFAEGSPCRCILVD